MVEQGRSKKFKVKAPFVIVIDFKIIISNCTSRKLAVNISKIVFGKFKF